MTRQDFEQMTMAQLSWFIRVHSKPAHEARYGTNPVTPYELNLARLVHRHRNRIAFNKGR